MSAIPPFPVTELDLDDHQPGDPLPPARPAVGHRLLAALLGCGLLGLAAGGWLGSALSTQPGPAGPELSAQLTVTEFLPGTPIAAVLHLVVDNHDGDDHLLTGLTVSGGGLAARRIPLDVPVPARQVQTLRLPDELTCSAGGGTSASGTSAVGTNAADTSASSSPGAAQAAAAGAGTGASAVEPNGTPSVPSVRLELADGSAVTAVPSGITGQPGGICSVAATSLPTPWEHQVRAQSIQFTGHSLQLRVAGFPADALLVARTEADGWLVPLSTGAVPIRADAATLELLPPSPGCSDSGTRGVLPVGLQLILLAPQGQLRQVYLPIGPALAGWLLSGRAINCPDSPGRA